MVYQAIYTQGTPTMVYQAIYTMEAIYTTGYTPWRLCTPLGIHHLEYTGIHHCYTPPRVYGHTPLLHTRVYQEG